MNQNDRTNYSCQNLRLFILFFEFSMPNLGGFYERKEKKEK